MKIRDILSYVDKYHHNDVEQQTKVQMLRDLDKQIMQELILPHEDREINTYTIDTELIIPDEYADAYKHYLAAQIALLSGQSKKYETYAAMYNNSYSQYARQYNRTHRMKRKRMIIC